MPEIFADDGPGDPTGWNLIGMIDHKGGIGNAARCNIQALKSLIEGRFRVISFPSARYTNPDMLPAIHGQNYLHFNPCSRRIEDLAMLPWFAHGRNIGFWAWETTQPPGRWLGYMPHMAQIWVPSHFVKTALCNGRFHPELIHVIPHAIDPAPAHVYAKDGARITFLVQYDGHSRFARKRPDLSIQAITLAALASRERVRIIVKSHHTANCAALGLVSYENVQIELVEQWISPKEMEAIWGRVDVLVSLNRGEGFGLPMVEAMARGIAVVATGWGGSEDYMTPANSFPVPIARLEPAARSGDPYFSTGSWSLPDVTAAETLIRDCMLRIRSGSIADIAGAARATAARFSLENMKAAMKTALSSLP